MPNWKHLVEHALQVRGSDSDEFIVMKGATRQDIDNLGTKLGIRFPEEFIDLYTTVNGFGIRRIHPERALEGWTDWTFRPLDEIQGFCGSVRKWFDETHPAVADRFFPFIDWNNGDGSGYLLSDQRSVLTGIFHFHHEENDRDEDQDVREFLTFSDTSLESFLALRSPIESTDWPA